MNVEAAAQAWLAKLPATERATAAAHTDLRLLIWFGAGAVVALTALALTRSGVLSRLRARIEAGGPRPWLAGAALAAVVAAVLSTVTALYDGLPVVAAAQGAAVGPHVAPGLVSGLCAVVPDAGLAVLVAAPLLALARWRPRSWAWIASGAFSLACLALGWGPYAFGPPDRLALAPPCPSQRGLLQLAADARLPVGRIYLSPDPAFDADVVGGFGHAAIIVGPRTLAWPEPEARAYVGHLMGHYAHADVFWVWLIWGLVGLAGLVGFAAAGPPLARALGAVKVEAASDPEALPAAAVVLVLALAVGTLATNGYLRWANVRADAFSLDHARAPDGLAAVIEREWDHESVDPSPLARWVFYSHPPLAARLRHAMAWRAAHGG